jgi:hypothetical protein
MNSKLIRRGTQAVALVTVLLGFTVGARATGNGEGVFHACVKEGNGQLRLVAPGTVCLPSERAVEWYSGGGAIATERSPEPQSFFQLVDGGGTAVGPVVGFQGLFPVVGVKLNGAAFVLFLADGVLYGTDMVYFESADCSPPGYIPHTAGALAASATGVSGQVYVEDRTAIDQPISVQAFAFGGQCYPFSAAGAAPRATSGPTLGVGPFQVR